MDLSKYRAQNVLLSDINTRNKAFQFRDDLKEAYMAKSLKGDGQQFPVVLRRKADGLLNIICGFRRVAGAKKLGWEKILAYVIPEADLSEQEALKLNFVENMERKTLKTLDVVFACDRLSKKGFSVRDIAKMINKGKTTVQKYQTVAKASDEVITKLKAGKLSIIKAYEIASKQEVSPGGTVKAKTPKMIANTKEKRFKIDLDIAQNPMEMGKAIEFLEHNLAKLKVLRQNLGLRDSAYKGFISNIKLFCVREMRKGNPYFVGIEAYDTNGKFILPHEVLMPVWSVDKPECMELTEKKGKRIKVLAKRVGEVKITVKQYFIDDEDKLLRHEAYGNIKII